MPGRNLLRTDIHTKIQKSLKFDLLIAQNIRVRRPPGLVFLEEEGKHPFPVFPRKIDRIIGDADLVADAADILKILICCTHAVFILFVPVFHKNAHDIIALLFQQIGADGGVYPARNSDRNLWSAHRSTPHLC